MTVYPIGHALWTSLHEVTLLFPGEPFVGLKNYQRVLSSNYFFDALRNSLVFTLIAAPSVVVIGTLIALFLQRRRLRAELAFRHRERIEQDGGIARCCARRGGIARPEIKIPLHDLPGRNAHPGCLLAEAGRGHPQRDFAGGQPGEPVLAALIRERLERGALHDHAHLLQIRARRGIRDPPLHRAGARRLRPGDGG